MVDAIVISDIHLGSDCCQSENLLNFLHWVQNNSQKLILNGDVFEDMNFRRLKKHHWQVLSKLRKMSDKIEIIWIAGNHDGPANIISDLIGLQVMKEYVLVSGDKKIIVFHGDDYDKFISEQPFLTWIGDLIYVFLQKLDKNQRWAKWAKNSSKHYLRCQEMIKKGATEYAKSYGYDAVFCGHSHATYDDGFYYNSGCWTEPPGTFIEVNDGKITLKYYLEKSSIV